MSIFDIFKTEKKENPVGASLFLGGNLKQRPDRKSHEYIKEGYEKNVIVYRAVREIVTALSDVTIEIKVNGEPTDTHPALELLKKPNPMMGGDGLFEALFTDFVLLGEMACVKYPENGNPIELWAVNPIDIEIIAGSKGVPQAYKHKKNNKEKIFKVDISSGASQLFFHKTYNPLDYWRGLSPLKAASLAGDTHNSGLQWNWSLLENGARQSGIIKFPDTPSGEDINRLREYFKKAIQGKHNAGEIPILTGDSDWIQTDQTARDMDYINTLKETSKYIASAFGVPLPLIENDAASYNNMREAKEKLWTDTVIPMLNKFLEHFSNWLLPYYGDNLEFCANLDSVSALESVRERRFKRMIDAVEKGILSPDEARAEIGYKSIGGIAQSLFVPANRIPLEMSGFGELPSDDKKLAVELRTLGYDEKTIQDTLNQKQLTESQRTPPKDAQNNARKVLEWRDEYPDEIQGMTKVGWRRANQLASGEALSEGIIKKMAQFNRHRENGKLDDDKKGKPWTDAGYVAWLGWGGTTGVDWAISMSEKLDEE